MFLESIITSEVRIRILVELYSETKKHLYVRELTRRVDTEINAVRRELKRFVKAGLVKKEKRGNRLYYLVRKDHPLYYEIISMVAKEKGIGRKILDNQNRVGKLKLAVLSTAFIEGRQSTQNELDLLIIGEVNLDTLSEVVREASIEMGREINYTVLGEEEFNYLKSRRDIFLLSFIASPHILLVGDSEKYLSFT